MTTPVREGPALSTPEFIAQLMAKSIILWVEDGDLCFRAPRGAMTPELRGQVPEHKPAIIELLGEGKKYACVSFAQQRLWVLDQMDPGASVYNFPVATFRIAGPLDREALKKSLNALVERHEALRTTFTSFAGHPAQVIALDATAELELKGGEGDEVSEILAAATEEVQKPFDLSAGPLFRSTLYRMGEDDHLLILPMHHIVTDGWSLGVLIRELSDLYKAYADGGEAALQALPMQYADYSVWQRQWLQGEVLDTQLAYWREKLRDLTTLKMPTDRPHPPIQTYRGTRTRFDLPESLTADLKALSRKSGATLYMTLLAAFKVLMHRYTGQEDIVVGSPIANRTQENTKDLIGFFVNTLVLRTDLSGNPTFLELIKRVRETALGAFEHQDLPFERLVQDLNPERDLSQTPLVQVVFSLQNQPMGAFQWPGLEVTREEFELKTSHFDIELHLYEESNSLTCLLSYSTDLFDASTMERFLGHWQRLLEGLVAAPEQPISEIPLLSAEERHRQLVEWNGTKTDYPSDASIQELFEEQAAQRPNATAVVFMREELTYGELNARANQLAHRLRGLGVKRESRVGLCMERNTEEVVATLAILKAGGAYVPLDPSYPEARLVHLLADSQVEIVLTDSALAETLPDHGGRNLCVDEERDAIARESAENPDVVSSATDLAYVMYTSGSTGLPKGAAVEHRNVVRLVKNTNYASFGADDVFFHFAAISFDATTFELWGSLLNGGKLIVYPSELPSLEDLGAAIKGHGVTTIFLTAGLFHQLVENQLESLRGVRQLLSGGEVLSVDHVRRVLETLENTTMINVYGPTENTTFTTSYPMTDVSQVGPTVSIGRPIANTRVYVLDGHQQPVPVGVPGELYIAGDGLAREYLNSPELTAERFVANRLPEEPGGRLYKTGDLVKYLPDGNIEFLGRLDFQVKVRGFRIELGEIESVLQQHPAVSESAVLVRKIGRGGKMLAAYVVLREDFAEDGLHAFLGERLPSYMIPNTFVMLDSMPLTANGKIDRRALPEPGDAGGQAKAYVAPRTPAEETLAAIWGEVLGAERVGIHDNFFELGGDSILSLQIVARAKDAGIHLSPKDLFIQRDIAGLARAAAGGGEQTPARQSNQSPVLVTIQEGANRNAFFFAAPLGGGTLPYYALGHYMGLDQPVYCLQDPAFDGTRKPCETIEEMAAVYIEAMRTVQPEGPYHIGGWSFGGLLAYEVSRQLERAGEQAGIVAIIDTSAEGKGPAREWSSLRGNLSFLVTLVLSSLQIARDSAYILATSKKREHARGQEGASRLTRLYWRWVDGFQDLYLKKANVAELVMEKESVLNIEQPSTRNFITLFRANTRALRRYTTPPSSGRVWVFRAEQAPDSAIYRDPTLGWAKRIPEDHVSVHTVGGDHFSMLRSPMVKDFGKLLRTLIDEVEDEDRE